MGIDSVLWLSNKKFNNCSSRTFYNILLGKDKPAINILEDLNFNRRDHLPVCVSLQSDIYCVDMKINRYINLLIYRTKRVLSALEVHPDGAVLLPLLLVMVAQ